MPSGLSWGVKDSFTEYLRGLPDGSVTATGGAAVDSGDMASWPLTNLDGFDADTAEGALTFSGAVRFSGHFGALDVPLAGLRLEVAAGSGKLVIDAVDGGARPTLDLATATIVEVTALPGHRAWLGTDVRLTSRGSVLFGGVYPAGTELDDLIVVLAGEDLSPS